MAEVRVKIGADIKDLQKGVRDAQNEVGKLGDAAKEASGGLNSAASGIEKLKAEARAAIAESRKLRGEMDSVAGASAGAGDEAERFGENMSGGLRGAAGAATNLAAKLAGGLGIAVLATAAAELQRRFVEAFTEGARAAEEARTVFERTLSSVADFSKLKGEVRIFENRDDILRTVAIVREEIERLNQQIEAAGGSADQAEGFLGISAQNIDAIARTTTAFFSDAQKQRNAIIDSLKKERGEQQGILDGLTEQLEALEARQEIGQTLAAAELKTKKEIEGQVEAIKEARKESEALLKLRAQAFAAVQQPPSPISSRQTPQANPFDFGPLPEAPERRFDESAIEDFLEQQARLQNAQIAYNEQLLQGNDLLTQFGVTGVDALANVALGFERLEDLGRIVSGIVRGLVRDLAVAAAKAALLTAIFPGAAQAAGGFRGIFGGLLRGGLGAAPAALSAAPASVAPLAGLSVQAQRVQVEPFTTTIRGGDLVLGFQQARQQTARTVGNIPLR